MRPLDIACRLCAAQPNEPCFDGWKWDNQTQSYEKACLDTPHEERTFDAATFGQAAVPVDKSLIEKAAEDANIV